MVNEQEQTIKIIRREAIGMILYFSGTGNSEYVAKRIGRETGDDSLDLLGKIRSRDHWEMR